MFTHSTYLLNQGPLKALLPAVKGFKKESAELNNIIKNFIFPPLCLNCHIPLQEADKLCSNCWQNLDFLVTPICKIKGTPLSFDIGSQAISAQALTHPPTYDQARSVAKYDGTMRNLIHKFKYQDRHELTNLLTNWLVHAGKELIEKSEIIIPIPLYRWRLWQRRFNQSALIANRLSEQTGLPIDCISFQRNKKTRSQVGLTSKERLTNVKGAFHIKDNRESYIKNKTILLIDDVITTGATVNSAAKTLKNAGAKSVNILSLAMVTNEHIEKL